MLSWPASLPQEMELSGTKETLPDAVLRTQMEAGPAKTRPKYTRAAGKMEAFFFLDENQRQVLKDFYRVETKSGEVTFFIPQPLSGELMEVQFLGPPRIEPAGAMYVGSIRYKMMEVA